MTAHITVQIFSDIHLEMQTMLPEIPVKAKYLILAGDICQLSHPLFYPLLDYCSVHWAKTVYIPGNHEYYSRTQNMTELEYQYYIGIRERYSNVFYLNNSSMDLEDGISLYGATFWTPSPFTTNREASCYVNDYNFIQYFKQGLDAVVELDIAEVNNLSSNAFDQLRNYLMTETNPTIVVTHFPPLRTNTSHPKYTCSKSVSNSYFSWPDDTVSKLNMDHVVAWISGHTHWSHDFQLDNTRYVSNQVGYSSERRETGVSNDGLYTFTVSS